MAKFKLEVPALESELEKIGQELEAAAAVIEAGEVTGDVAVKTIKDYQKLLDKNTYLLVQRANLKLSVNATAPKSSGEATESGEDAQTQSDTGAEGTIPPEPSSDETK